MRQLTGRDTVKWQFIRGDKVVRQFTEREYSCEAVDWSRYSCVAVDWRGYSFEAVYWDVIQL